MAAIPLTSRRSMAVSRTLAISQSSASWSSDRVRWTCDGGSGIGEDDDDEDDDEDDLESSFFRRGVVEVPEVRCISVGLETCSFGDSMAASFLVHDVRMLALIGCVLPTKGRLRLHLVVLVVLLDRCGDGILY